MKHRPRRSTAVYVEILLLLLCLILCLMVLMRVFAAASATSRQAQQLTDAVLMAQQAAECFAATEDNAALQKALPGSEQTDESTFAVTNGKLRIIMHVEEQQTVAGVMRTAAISVVTRDSIVYELTTQRYWPGGNAA